MVIPVPLYVAFDAGLANNSSPPSSPWLLLKTSCGTDKICVPSNVKLALPLETLELFL
jgi:hypothetical protein